MQLHNVLVLVTLATSSCSIQGSKVRTPRQALDSQDSAQYPYGSCICQVNCPESVEDECGEESQGVQTLSSKLDQLRGQTEARLNDLEKKIDTLIEALGVSVPDSPVDGGDVSALPPRDCMEVKNRGGGTSGVYTVYLGCDMVPYRVYCDLDTGGGGWMVFQRRKDGSEDFYRNWADYARGFGNLSGEFWIGNQALYLATERKSNVLRIDMMDHDNVTGYVTYSTFRVDDEDNDFKLTLGTYSGTAGDSLTYHNGQYFTTKDRDNDAHSQNCARKYYGGFWYKSCFYANLNGLYGPQNRDGKGVNWFTWTDDVHYSLKFVEMKIRPHEY